MSSVSDATFPGLRAALELGPMLETLRQELPECREGLAVEDGTILDVRYRPDGSCCILYRLKLRPPGGRSIRQLLSARLLRRGERFEPPPAQLLSRYAQSERPLRRGFYWLPALSMVLHPYPLDVALPGLFDAIDAGVLKNHLSELWRDRGVRVRRVTVHALGYTPQARAAFRYDVLGEARKTSLPEIRRLIGKMHAKKSAERLFADQWAVWRAGGGRLSIAPPIGYLPSVGLTLQEYVPGVRLGGLVEHPDFLALVRRTARALAELHDLNVPLSSKRKARDEVDTVHRWAGVIAAVRPDLAPRVERLRDRISTELTARTQPSGPIHADFHHTNVLVDGQSLTIIDLDEMAFGDPMVDVGRFLASLRVPARRAFGDIRGLAAAGESFLAEYQARTGADGRRARLFEAAALLIAAGSSFRIQRRGWQEEAAQLIEETERVLELSVAGPVAAVANRASKGRPPRGGAAAAGPARRDRSARRSPALEGDRGKTTPARDSGTELAKSTIEQWAADPIYMQALLSTPVGKLYGAELRGVRLLGKSESRRFRYQARGRREGRDWTLTLDAVERSSGAAGFLRRLAAMRSALAADQEGLLLPRPLVYLSMLRLVVWQPPAGTRLSSMLSNGGAVAGAESLARALAAFHRAPVTLAKPYTTEHELSKVRALLAGLSDCDGLGSCALRLLGEVERRSTPGPLGPALRTIDPRHVLCQGSRVALEKVEEVAWAHPLLDAGDFLSRLTLLGLQRGTIEEARRAADGFRAAYRLAGAAAGSDLAAFEAGALLRLAARTRIDRGLARALLDHAERVLQ